MLRHVTMFILAVGLLVGPGFTWASDEKKAEKATPDSTETKGAEALSAAYTLAQHGREIKSPELLLAAARLIGTTSTQKVNITKAKLNSKAVDDDPITEVANMIAEAKKLGADSDMVSKLAASVEKDVKEFKRGRIGGPHSWQGFVEARFDKTDEFFITFQGHKSAIISLNNLSNQGDLDLYVYDLDNRLVAQDRRSAGSARVQFFPNRDNEYRVVIRAYSDRAPMHYKLVTN